jgi:alpha-tubulin suppressor-like RCC1 family protein
MRHARFALTPVALAAALLAGCSGRDSEITGSEASEPPGLLLVSDLMPATDGGPKPATPHVFASLPAGSIPGGTLATIRNRASGATIAVPVVDGAVDPVAVVAALGDTLELTAVDSSGTEHHDLGQIKRDRVPPVVVRSAPARGATDSPMMLRAHIVFSEPIDLHTVNASSIQILLRDQAIDGQVTLSDDGLVADFTPTDSLAPGATYTILVTREVEDVTGDPLAQEYRADFTVVKPFSPGLNLASVSAGFGFTCALSHSGRVFCWGRGDLGQNGVAGQLDRHKPALLSTGHILTNVEAGYEGACGLTDARRVLCWGTVDTTGGTNTIIPVPTPVFGDREMLAAVAGGQRMCALSLDKATFCFGSVLINGGPAYPLLQPEPVWPAIADLTRLRVGAAHICYLLANGHAECYESNAYGELGTGEYGDPGQWYGNVSVIGGLAFDDVTVGDNFTCGLVVRQAYCWGFGAHGRLGIGALETQNAPTPVVGGLQFLSIDAGARHACAITVDATAYCWGDNIWGQLGDGTRLQRLVPVPVAGHLSFTAISAGVDHTCALTTDEVLYCWGANHNGQLGDGSTTDALTPIKVANQP